MWLSYSSCVRSDGRWFFLMFRYSVVSDARRLHVRIGSSPCVEGPAGLVGADRMIQDDALHAIV
jgi:hypothetical protein